MGIGIIYIPELMKAAAQDESLKLYSDHMKEVTEQQEPLAVPDPSTLNDQPST